MRFLSTLCLIGFLAISIPSIGQDTLSTAKWDSPKNKWYAPDQVVIQHAGLIGLLSAGVGYDFGKHDRTNIDIMYGFTPGYNIKSTTHSFTLRAYYQSHPKPLFRDYKISWIKAGAGISMTAGNQFETFWPKRYPNGYYIWPTATRILPFVGSSIGRDLKMKDRLHYLEFYGELGTSDVMIVDKVRNKGISVGDILNVAIGLRFKL